MGLLLLIANTHTHCKTAHCMLFIFVCTTADVCCYVTVLFTYYDMDFKMLTDVAVCIGRVSIIV